AVTAARWTTGRLPVSVVGERWLHSGHWRRRRIEEPSSDVRESTARESAGRQNGQCMAGSSAGPADRSARRTYAVAAGPCNTLACDVRLARATPPRRGGGASGPPGRRTTTAR